MARHPILQAFYSSDVWITFRLRLIAERGNLCEHCGQFIADATDITAHHIIELTPENVHNHLISLNSANVMLVHSDCHNQIHQRFGYQSKRVFVVWGAPLSGKSTFVAANARRGDLVVDMDRLFEAITMQPSFDKPDALFTNVTGLYNLLIDNIQTRYGKWHNAWVVGGFADKYKREKLITDLGAEGVFCRTSKVECLARLATDTARQPYKAEWTRYIEDWFDRFVA